MRAMPRLQQIPICCSSSCLAQGAHQARCRSLCSISASFFIQSTAQSASKGKAGRREQHQHQPQRHAVGGRSDAARARGRSLAQAGAAAAVPGEPLVDAPARGGGAGGSGSGGGGPRRRGDDGGSGAGDDQPPPSPRQLGQLLAALAGVLLPALALPAAAAASTVAANKAGKAASAAAHGGKAVDVSLPSWELDAFVDRMWGLSGPIINNMGFSGLLGACAAAALKWVGRTLAASVGIGLILVQVLSHYNVITVNWSVVHKQARQVLDRTGDGRLDQDDFKRVVKQGLIVLSEGVPSLSGFLVGFLVGLKLF